MSISPAFLDELRARTDLPGLLGRSVKLTRAGREWRGCCPFHNEKSPSFYVYADHYHCFGCGAHGDAIRWLTEKQGLPFPEAVAELAAQAGLEVPKPTRAERERAERAATLGDVVAEAARFFSDQLWGPGGGVARDYLQRRGVSAETARAFGLGFAPDDRTALKRALKACPEPLLVEAGLLIAPEERDAASFDRFRNRLIFPIRDARGRPVGFGGRAFGDVKPKYLNSPDTPLFDKGRLLFNLDRAAAPARERGRLLLVEGYMDVIALAQAGITEAVAPLGTALTEHQLGLAWRQVAEPMLCFDGDAAGLRAAEKAAKRALPGLAPGRSVRIATLPPGKDPDDLVRESGRAGMDAVLADAEPLHRTLWRAALAGADTATPEGRAGLRVELDSLAESIAHPEVKRQYAAEFRARFWDEFGWKKPERRAAPEARGSGARRGRFAAPAPPEAARVLRTLLNPRDRDGVLLIAGLLDHPDVAADRLEGLAALGFTDERLRRLRDALVESLGMAPDLDSAALGNTLHLQGLADSVRWARGTAARVAGKATKTADRDEICGRLATMVEAPAAVEGNRAARRSVGEGLKAALGRDGGAAEALFEAHRALVLRQRDLHESLYEQTQAARSDGAAVQSHSRVKAEDGEGKHGDGGSGHGGEGL